MNLNNIFGIGQTPSMSQPLLDAQVATQQAALNNTNSPFAFNNNSPAAAAYQQALINRYGNQYAYQQPVAVVQAAGWMQDPNLGWVYRDPSYPGYVYVASSKTWVAVGNTAMAPVVAAYPVAAYSYPAAYGYGYGANFGSGYGGMLFGAPGQVGVGQNVGAASMLDATTADNACTSVTGPGGDGFVSANPPADVLQLLTPNNDVSGPDPRFALYKGDIWRFTKQMAYAKCAGVDPLKLPGATPPTNVGAQAGTPSWVLPVVIGAIAIVAGGAAAYYVTRKPKSEQQITREEMYSMGMR